MKSIFLLCLIISLNACTFFVGYDELKLEREDSLGDKLRMDGYYFNDDGKTTAIIFFYRNGIVLTVTYSSHKIPEIENRLKNGSLTGKDFVHRDHWGIFRIEGNKIFYEKWAAQAGYKPAFIHSGTILNDTTFIITSRQSNSKLFDSEKYYETQIIYLFKAFDPKPDSTSKFIE